MNLHFVSRKLDQFKFKMSKESKTLVLQNTESVSIDFIHGDLSLCGYNSYMYPDRVKLVHVVNGDRKLHIPSHNSTRIFIYL